MLQPAIAHLFFLRKDLSLGIFRSDYMLQAPSTADGMPSLKQVEFNTHSVAGVSHACNVARLHQ